MQYNLEGISYDDRDIFDLVVVCRAFDIKKSKSDGAHRMLPFGMALAQPFYE